MRKNYTYFTSPDYEVDIINKRVYFNFWNGEVIFFTDHICNLPLAGDLAFVMRHIDPDNFEQTYKYLTDECKMQAFVNVR